MVVPTATAENLNYC